MEECCGGFGPSDLLDDETCVAIRGWLCCASVQDSEALATPVVIETVNQGLSADVPVCSELQKTNRCPWQGVIDRIAVVVEMGRGGGFSTWQVQQHAAIP